jgi:hypothetical protein
MQVVNYENETSYGNLELLAKAHFMAFRSSLQSTASIIMAIMLKISTGNYTPKRINFTANASRKKPIYVVSL